MYYNNASHLKESVLSLKEKTAQHWSSYFQITCKY